MRRAFVLLISVVGLCSSASIGYGQYPYPYPYSPMPMPYPPQYGYPMPVYQPNPMMARPMYYAPAPMMQPNLNPPQKVMVLGPLTDRPVYFGPQPTRVTPAYLPTQAEQAAAIRQAQADVKTAPVVSKNELPPEACGSDCEEACGPGIDCNMPRWARPIRGRGHFIGEVGAYLLIPFSATRTAFNSQTGGITTGTNFPTRVDFGPRLSVGYIAHTGWGARVNYWYLQGVVHTTAGNAPGTATTITTPLPAPFLITSPGTSLNAGVGVDNFLFSERLRLHVADTEFVRECSFLDTNYLFSFGGRYADITQSYTASRTNPGGVVGGNAVALDNENLNSSSYFHGWGPTASIEAIHPLVCGFSAYGSVRGSLLFGVETFGQNYSSINRTTNPAGVVNFAATSLNANVYDNRLVPILEPEAGLQFGFRCGRGYWFGRVGAVYQRWWNVGSPTTANGYLSFVGGTARIGVAY